MEPGQPFPPSKVMGVLRISATDASSPNGKAPALGAGDVGSSPTGAVPPKYPEAVPGVISFACGHRINVGFGPARVSKECCRNCLGADGELGMGATEPVDLDFGSQNRRRRGINLDPLYRR